jgi:hypothetical protein
MWILHVTFVAIDELHTLSLTPEIVATVLRDGTESRFFYTDLINFLNLSI